MKPTVIPVVIGTLGTISKEFVKGLEDSEIRGQEETTLTAALLRPEYKEAYLRLVETPVQNH